VGATLAGNPCLGPARPFRICNDHDTQALSPPVDYCLQGGTPPSRTAHLPSFLPLLSSEPSARPWEERLSGVKTPARLSLRGCSQLPGQGHRRPRAGSTIQSPDSTGPCAPYRRPEHRFAPQDRAAPRHPEPSPGPSFPAAKRDRPVRCKMRGFS